MYAIIATCGKQYRVQQGDKLSLDRLDAEVGSDVTFDQVLLVDNDGDITVGSPNIEGATVTAKVVAHDKGDKVTTFKYRRRQRTRRKVGFRAALTQLEITGINS